MQEIQGDLLYEHPEEQSAYDQLRINDTALWKLVGFDNYKAYDEYISPDTQSMLESASELELLLIERLLTNRQVNAKVLLEEGYPKPAFVQVINTLVLDKYVKNDNDVDFTLTKVGFEILTKLYAKRVPNLTATSKPTLLMRLLRLLTSQRF